MERYEPFFGDKSLCVDLNWSGVRKPLHHSEGIAKNENIDFGRGEEDKEI